MAEFTHVRVMANSSRRYCTEILSKTLQNRRNCNNALHYHASLCISLLDKILKYFSVLSLIIWMKNTNTEARHYIAALTSTSRAGCSPHHCQRPAIKIFISEYCWKMGHRKCAPLQFWLAAHLKFVIFSRQLAWKLHPWAVPSQNIAVVQKTLWK